MKFDDQGREIPDNTPVELPLGFRAPPTLQEEIARLIRVETSRIAQANGMETFEEADDFSVDDPDGDFHSEYEMTELQEEVPLRSSEKGGRFRDASDLDDDRRESHGKRRRTDDRIRYGRRAGDVDGAGNGREGVRPADVEAGAPGGDRRRVSRGA